MVDPRNAVARATDAGNAALLAGLAVVDHLVRTRRFAHRGGLHLILGEYGNQLFRADLVAAGKVIYRDFSCQYGPIPTYLYAGVAALFGNTLAVNQGYHLALRVVCLVLFYALMRKRFRPAVAFLIAVVVAPAFLPMGEMGVFTHIEYIPVEVALWLTVMLLYEPPDRRGVGRCRALGVLLGLCQWVKFGGGIVFGLAALVLDVLWVCRVRPGRETVRRWLTGLLHVSAAFLAVEAAFVAFAFGLCRRDVALDAVWPLYMTRDYATAAQRWPVFVTWYAFRRLELLPVSCLIFGLFALISDARARFAKTSGEALGAYIGLIFYLIAVPNYLGHRYLFHQYFWTLVPAGALVVGAVPGFARAAVVCVWLAATVSVLKTNYRDPVRVVPPTRAYPLPTGEVAFLDRNEAAVIDALRRVARRVEREDPRRRVLLIDDWQGLAFYHYFAAPPPLRNLLIAPHGFRPHDDRELRENLGAIGAIVWRHPVEPRAALSRVFSPALTEAILGRFTRVHGEDLEDSRLVTVLVPLRED